MVHATNARHNNRRQAHRPERRSSNVKIVGEGRDSLNRRYFKFEVSDGSIDIPPVPVKKIIDKSFLAELANANGNLFTNRSRTELLQQLQNHKSSRNSFVVATKLGWQSGAFVRPDQIIGTPNQKVETYFGDLDGSMLTKYRTRRTLEQWQRFIARPCSRNSRLMFALCLAFTGPILWLVPGPKSGGFQLVGPPETGKTTAGKLTGSVWGCHRGEGRRDKGFIESWNATEGKIEVTALAHNEIVLILDETKNAGTKGKDRGKTVLGVAFALAEQTEKDRLTNSAPARGWRCYFLSTSNLNLAQLARDAGMQITDAEIGRLADIPLPKGADGIFEDLKNFETGEAFSNALQSRCLKYYGTAGLKFLRRLVKQISKDGADPVRHFLQRERKRYLKSLNRRATAKHFKPLRRISDRFATTYAAGCLAIKYGILPWNRKRLLRAIRSCQLDHLEVIATATEDTNSIAGMRSRLVKYIRDNWNAFRLLKKKGRLKHGVDEINAYPGFRQKWHGKRYLYLTPGQLTTAVGTKDLIEFKRALVKEGLLEMDSQGRFVVQRPIFRGGRGTQNLVRVHAIKAELVSNDTEGKG